MNLTNNTVKPYEQSEFKKQDTRLIYRDDKSPVIFVSAESNVALIMHAIAGSIPKHGGSTTEVTSISSAVPCDATGMHLDVDLLMSTSGPVLPSIDFPNLMILGTGFINQEGSVARTDFDMPLYVDLADEKFSKSYSFLKKENNKGNRYGMFWTHSHPNGYGTMPSGVDYETFEKHTRAFPSFHMFIIDRRLATPTFNINNTTLRTCIKNYTIVGKKDIPNPYIDSFIFANIEARNDVQIIGLGMQYLYYTYPHIYADICNNTISKDGYNVWDIYGENEIHVPSPWQIHEVVSSPNTSTVSNKSYYQPKGKFQKPNREQGPKKGGFFDDIFSKIN